MNVLIYNVCYKAIKGIDKMITCWENNENKCVSNIAKWFAKDSCKQFNIDMFDFIGIQELDINNNLEWKDNLYIKIKNINPNFFDNYTIKNNSTTVSFYDNTKYSFISQNKVELDPITKDRPCLILYLKNKQTKKFLYFINCHFPHSDEHTCFERIKNKIKDRQADIILCGDFNHTPKRLDIKNISKNMYHNKNSIYKSPTCCDSKGSNHKYKYYGDQIFSTFRLKRKEIGDMSIYCNINCDSFTSDHLPVMCKF